MGRVRGGGGAVSDMPGAYRSRGTGLRSTPWRSGHEPHSLILPSLRSSLLLPQGEKDFQLAPPGSGLNLSGPCRRMRTSKKQVSYMTIRLILRISVFIEA